MGSDKEFVWEQESESRYKVIIFADTINRLLGPQSSQED